jgi:putative drug exporter of the RND superfamily
MLARLARWCFVRRRATLAIWVLSLLGIGIIGNAIIGSDYSSEFEIPASESASGIAVLTEGFGENGGGGQSASIVFRSATGVNDPAVVAAMETLFAEVEALDGVAVASPYTAAPVEMGGVPQISTDGTIAYATLNLRSTLGQTEMMKIGEEIGALIPEIEGLQVEIGGQALSEFDPPEAELIGLAFAIVILILSFGSVLAMGLPIGVALFGVGIGASLVAMISQVMGIPDFAVTLGAMLGLAVGIDYSLFIVTRFRDEVRRGLSYEEAAVLAIDTAGRAVLFAGLTVVVSLLGMLLIGLQFISGLGIGAATTVAVTMVAAVTLLPAFLGFAQERIEITRWRGIIASGFMAVALLGAGLGVHALLFAAPIAAVILLAGFAIAPLRKALPVRTPKEPRTTLPYLWSRFVQAHPWSMLFIGAATLMLLAAPVLSLRLGFSDEGNFAPDTTTRKAYDMLAEGFGPGFNGPLTITGELTGAEQMGELVALVAAVGADPGVQTVSPPFPNAMENPTAFLIQVVPTTSPQDQATVDLVERLRGQVIPGVLGDSTLEVFVAGSVAISIDFTSYLSDRLIIFIGVVLLVSFVLLMMVFRSILVPIKAVLMNIISIASAYGVVVAIFQWGWLKSVFGVEPAPIEPFVPMMMFAIVFGLSMDYEVFLLSRIREEWDRTRDAVSSVADGLAATARVITAAAAIMIVVFGSFLLDDNRILKLFGVGLAVAVFLDATLVRMLLVPATMALLGDRNWWLPTWLDRILPHLNVEGPAPADHLIEEPELVSR